MARKHCCIYTLSCAIGPLITTYSTFGEVHVVSREKLKSKLMKKMDETPRV
jgi:hypothetical protein